MSNRPNHFTVEFHEGDAPMLVHAMIIASNTAMMCGYPGAKERFNTFKKKFEEYVPAISKLFDEEEWSEIIAKLQHVDNYVVEFQSNRWHWGEPTPEQEGTIFIRIGEARFAARGWNLKRNDPVRRAHLADLLTTLDRLAPLGCTGTVVELEREV